jgi:two-component system, NarL family, sensor histidine kinase EvgS
VVLTDPLRLKQVLTNLLSNACKYTQHGKVSLHASVLVSEHSTGTLQLVVQDSGIGISAAEQALLFQPFVTLNDTAGAPNGTSSATSAPTSTPTSAPTSVPIAEPSSGLGLAMSRKVATLLGGTIELASQPGKGTRATLRLPLPAQLAKHTGAAPAALAQPGAVDYSGTVLVCDDDDTSRLLMAHMLRQQGLAVAETGSSAQALAMWRSGEVRALVSDLDMPGMGGTELMQIIRREENKTGTRTPIIVCSGSQVATFNPAGEQPLYDAYLVKPVDLQTLAATLRQLGVVQTDQATAAQTS